MAEGTAVATVDPSQRHVQAVFTPGQQSLRTSLPTDTLEEKIAAAALAADDTEKFSKMIGETVTITDVLIHEVEMVDEKTSEIKPAHRTVLITDHGNIAAVSNGIIMELGKLAALFGPAQTWREKGGITVRPKQVDTRNGFRTYVLIPVGLAGKVSATPKGKRA